MKIHLISDLHVDIHHNAWTPPNDFERDVVLCVGDVMAPASFAVRWLRENFPEDRIVYVMGNHEYYSDGRPKAPEGAKTTFELEKIRAREAAAAFGVNLLDDDTVVIEGVRFVGSTLWTDFSQRPEGMRLADASREATSRSGMNDYRLIKTGRGRSKDMLEPRQTIDANKAAVAFIEATLAEPFDGPTVVATHHVPVPNDGTPKGLDWCYFNDLSHLFNDANSPDLWCHGHVHRSVDRVFGRTRLMANPRGYPLLDIKNAPRENPGFDERLVVSLRREYKNSMR